MLVIDVWERVEKSNRAFSVLKASSTKATVSMASLYRDHWLVFVLVLDPRAR